MKKRLRTSALELPTKKSANVEVRLKAVLVERERLLKALERIRNKKQRLQKETNRLFENAKILNCILARSHQGPVYLRRDG